MKVLIADDEPIARQILREHIESIPALEDAGVAATGAETLARILETQPDVVQPAMISVSTRRLLSRGTRSVPKKHDAYFLTNRISRGPMLRRGSILTASEPAVRVKEPFIFRPQMPASFTLAPS